MARAARTATVIVALLGALLLAPSAASAGVIAQTDVVFPAEVTVGQTGVAGSLTLTNANDGTEFFSANQVCNVDSMSPCDGTGITLTPSCAAEGEMMTCDAPDPGVFDIAATATGTGFGCPGTVFDVTDLGDGLGSVVFTPSMPAGELTLPSEGGSCTIDFTFDVVKAPAGGGGVTTPSASAKQYLMAAADVDRTTTTVTVFKATPAIATQASAGVAVGGTVTDTATVTGRVNPTAGATVTFSLFGPDDPTCQPPAAFVSEVPIADDGTATSAPFPTTQPGTYRWLASYNGDDNNASVNGGCGDPGETVVVTPAVVNPPPPPPPPATPTIAILASPGIVLGGIVSAGVTVTQRVNPVGGATVLFRLYGPDDPGCAATPVFAATVPLREPGSAVSPPFAPQVLPGTYRWVARYSGDPNNATVATACNAPGSTVAVTALPAAVLNAGFASQPRVGESSVLTIAAFDPLRPITGMQVQFGEPRGLSGASACRLPGFGVGFSPVRLRLPYTFRLPGRHTITIVVLSGTCGGELTRTVRTIVVTVAANESARGFAAARGSAPAARAAQQASCKNRFLRPSSKAATRLKVATAILCLVNAERRKQGLKALKRSSVLARAASGHSSDMLKRRYFEHSGPGGPTLRTRLTKVRYRGAAAGENIAYGSNFNAKLVMQAWMNSPPHKANILSPRFKFLGVGIAVGLPVSPGRPGSTYTQNFGSSLK